MNPYRTAAELPQKTAEPTSRHTWWSKLRHWFWGFGCSHMGARSSRHSVNGNVTHIVHKCERCGDTVQIDWLVDGVLDDRWP